MANIYLDMDGVIADFFGLWADSCGAVHWKSIKEKEKSKINRFIKFFSFGNFTI